MDLTSIIGTLVGLICILIGAQMEGVHLDALLQITAGLIVIGGTAGAVILSFPQEDLMLGVKALKKIYLGQKVEFREIITELVKYASKARKEGVIALEKEARKASDPLITLGLEAVSDGADPKLVRELLEAQLTQMEAESKAAAKVWESAGGYCPCIGIIGAVLGLIHVMGSLDDPSKLGSGIAVAFVATIYGVGLANLIFIPFGTKIKFIDSKIFVSKEMIIEGILAIQAGESPALIERKLQAFLLEKGEGKLESAAAKV